MENKTKTVILFVVLSLIAILSVVSIIYKHNQDNRLTNFNNIEISKSDLSDILNSVPEGSYKLCSLETGKCTIFKKGKLNY